VLDLFAGTGALGIEAVSRGAASAVLVEQAAPAVAVIRANLDALDLNDRVKVRRTRAETYLRTQRDGPFDLVLLDPPYGAPVGLVAGLLGVLEVGGAGLGALEGMIEDADDIVLLIAGSSRVFARGHRSLLSARGRLLGSRVGPSTGGEGYVYPDGDNVRPAGRNG
jgi:tRNA A58 N-methylase Trm61